MSCEVLVPQWIREEIAELALPAGLEATLYEELQARLELGHETTCFRLPAPTPTFVFVLELPAPVVPGAGHWFTFHLTEGEKPDTLVVQQAFYDYDEPGSREEDEDGG
jgi:hypothetical protein